MKLIADESVDYSIVRALRYAGLEVEAVVELFPGCSDELILRYAFENYLIVITLDKDFGELSFRLKKPNHGIILARFGKIATELKTVIILNAIQQHFSEMENKLTVVTQQKIRIITL